MDKKNKQLSFHKMHKKLFYIGNSQACRCAHSSMVLIKHSDGTVPHNHVKTPAYSCVR